MRLLLAALSLAITTPTLAAEHTVKFPAGTTGTTLSGSVTGDASETYYLGTGAGQVMAVSLHPDNASCYFNVYTPDAYPEALYNASIDGNDFTGTTATAGDYRVDVYLMRNEGRRGTTCTYTIDFAIAADDTAATSAAPAPGRPVPPDSMVAYCVGEVAGQYGTRPMYVSPGELLWAADGSASIDGTVDQGTDGIKQFRCRYDPKNVFIDVMALTSDGE